MLSLLAKKTFVLDVFISFIVIFIGQLPIVLHAFHTPQGSYYPYLDTLAPSDYYYPALVRYGMGPDWLLKIPYVPQDHKGSFIQIFFVLLGKVALVTGLGPAEIFAVSRVLGGIIFIASVVYFLHRILPKEKARWAFLFFLLAQPLPVSLNIFKEDIGMWVWHFGEAARRVSSLPSHYTIGKGLAVLALGLIIHAVRTKNMKVALLSGVIIFVAGMIYPPPVFIILFSLGVAAVVWIFIKMIEKANPKLKIQNPNKIPSSKSQIGFRTLDLKKLVVILLFVIGSVLPLLILRMELAKGFPWDMWQHVELGWNDPSMRFEANYIRQLGSILIFVPFALVSIIKRRNYSYLTIFTIVWVFSAFLLFLFAQKLSLGKFRFTEGVQILPLALLALSGLTFLKTSLVKIAGIQFTRLVTGGVVVLLVFNFFLFTLLKAKHSTLALWGHFANAYFPSYELEALEYLFSIAPAGSVVIADLYSSGYIPIFARVKTIIGFSDFFPSSVELAKEHETINSLLQGKLSEQDAAAYLTSRHIGYAYNKFVPFIQPLYPSLLEPIFSGDSVMIYKVRVGNSSQPQL